MQHTHHHRNGIPARLIWLMNLRALGLFVLTLAASGPAAAGADDRPLAFNIDENVAAFFDALSSGEVGSYAVIGDSISFRGDSYHWFLRDHLEAAFGNGGDGYLGFNGGFKSNAANGPREGLAYRKQSSVWAPSSTSQNLRDALGRRSPDGIYTRIGGPGWIEVDFYGPSAILHYVREFGAGNINVELNGKTIATLDASLEEASDPALGLFSFETGQPDPNVLNTLRLSLIGASTQDPQWTQLNGLQMTTGNAGAVLNRIARGGVGPDDFLSADPAIYADVLASLAPQLLIVMLDPGRDDRFDQYVDDLNSLLDFYEATLPDAGIVLISHHPFRENRELITIWEIAAASARGHGFINLFDLHLDLDDLQARNMLVDTVHFNANGGAWHGCYVFDTLRGWNAAADLAIRAGTIVEGGLYEVRNSDDERLDLASQFGFLSSAPNVVELEAGFLLDRVQPDVIDVRAEWSINNPLGSVGLRLRNWNTGQFVQIAATTISQSESIMELTDIPIDSAFRSNADRVDIRTRVVVVATFSTSGFRMRVDDLKLRLR
ncbi:MAG: SGNH/GDSL hydrolase family protein [Phycisphaerales bacterium]